MTDNVTGVTDTIRFKGPVGSFSAQSDGSAGTLITDPPSSSNMVAVSHDQDAFVFACHLGENAVANVNAHRDASDPPQPEFAGLTALMTEPHNDAAIHDGTEIANVDHAMGMAAHHAHGFLV